MVAERDVLTDDLEVLGLEDLTAAAPTLLETVVGSVFLVDAVGPGEAATARVLLVGRGVEGKVRALGALACFRDTSFGVSH
ncbi:MAG: hypothetical protein ACI8QC_000704 [Planctomycetota bacterium]|jgi:hypothetical protein